MTKPAEGDNSFKIYFPASTVAHPVDTWEKQKLQVLRGGVGAEAGRGTGGTGEAGITK